MFGSEHLAPSPALARASNDFAPEPMRYARLRGASSNSVISSSPPNLTLEMRDRIQRGVCEIHRHVAERGQRLKRLPAEKSRNPAALKIFVGRRCATWHTGFGPSKTS